MAGQRGRSGRRPAPTHLKLLAGNPGKRRLNPNEPRPEPGVPDMPAWLPRRARPFWGRLVADLEPLGVLTKADVFALAMLADCLGEWRAKAARGKPVDGPSRRALSMFAHFGLTPADRSKVVAVVTEPDDPLERLRNKGRGDG